MKPTLYAHPFSSYCQKAQIALYANGVDFDYREVGPDPDVTAEFKALWPIAKFPILVDGGRTLLESSIIIEHVDTRYPGPVRFIPQDSETAIEARMLDRVFDNYVMTPASKFVLDAIRPEDGKDPAGVADAGAQLDTVYAWLDTRMAGREWAVGDTFSLADCAAAPSLFYADWVREIPEQYENLRAYRARLLAWAPFARCVDEARYFRPYFPLGAPDRD